MVHFAFLLLWSFRPESDLVADDLLQRLVTERVDHGLPQYIERRLDLFLRHCFEADVDRGRSGLIIPTLTSTLIQR